VLDAIHELDYVCDIMGKPQATFAIGVNTGALPIDTEDVAEYRLEYPDNVMATVHLDYLSRVYSRSCIATCADASVMWDFGSGSVVRWIEPGQDPEVLGAGLDKDRNEMYMAEMRHVLDCVAGDAHSRNNVRSAAMTLRVALEAKTARSL
jgi:predicted dehydrogenase